MEKKRQKEIAEIVCQAWKNLDASLLEPIISEDFEYVSVWVLETMNGKSRYMEYITGKFDAIRKGDNPVRAEVVYQDVIDKFVVVLNQGNNLAALEPTIIDDKLKSLWMRPIDMTLPAVFTSKKHAPAKTPIPTEKQEDIQETENGRFSRLFLEALLTKDFSVIESCLAEDVIQILYDNKEFLGKGAVIAYWKDWLERWNEPSASTEYEVKWCKYYDRDVLSISPQRSRTLYQIARIEDGKVKQLVLCPNPTQSPLIRYWDLDHAPLLFSNHSVMPHKMGKDLEPRTHKIPCMRCGCKSENLQWYEYQHDAGPLGYAGELSVCTNCMEAVEFFPTILLRYK